MRIKLKIAVIMATRNQARFAFRIGKKEEWLSRVITGRINPTDEEKALIGNQFGIDTKSTQALELFEIS